MWAEQLVGGSNNSLPHDVDVDVDDDGDNSSHYNYCTTRAAVETRRHKLACLLICRLAPATAAQANSYSNGYRCTAAARPWGAYVTLTWCSFFQSVVRWGSNRTLLVDTADVPEDGWPTFPGTRTLINRTATRCPNSAFRSTRPA